ncbi:MAG: LuxR C-terminal-related transcriptional regulator [Candidatus Thiodiazotropha sp.]|jgi:DNA-binding CsgD family transcriptional regulator
MTPKQKKVYAMLLMAKSYDEIAHALSISKETVKTHCRDIYRMHKVKNRCELMAQIIEINNITQSPISHT